MMSKTKAITSGTIEAEVIQVIKTKATVGSGTEEDPNHYEIKYWSLDGQLLAEED